MRVKAGDAVLALVCVAVGHVLGNLFADWLDGDAAASPSGDEHEDGDAILQRPENDALAVQLEARAPLSALRGYPGTSSANNPYLCTVCLDAVRPGMQVRWTPCGHLFHARCLAKWVYTQIERAGRRRPACPNCNAELGVVGPRRQSTASAAASAAGVEQHLLDEATDDHYDIVEPPTRRDPIRIAVSQAVLDSARDANVPSQLVAEDAYVRVLAGRRRAALLNAAAAGAGAAQAASRSQ